jgi:hypothetical protein
MRNSLIFNGFIFFEKQLAQTGKAPSAVGRSGERPRWAGNSQGKLTFLVSPETGKYHFLFTRQGMEDRDGAEACQTGATVGWGWFRIWNPFNLKTSVQPKFLGL